MPVGLTNLIPSPLMPAERAICGVYVAVTEKHRRLDTRRALEAGAGPTANSKRSHVPRLREGAGWGAAWKEGILA